MISPDPVGRKLASVIWIVDVQIEHFSFQSFNPCKYGEFFKL